MSFRSRACQRHPPTPLPGYFGGKWFVLWRIAVPLRRKRLRLNGLRLKSCKQRGGCCRKHRFPFGNDNKRAIADSRTR